MGNSPNLVEPEATCGPYTGTVIRPALTVRELPSDEWHRLNDTGLSSVWQILPPADATVLVVEDAAGQIVGCWSMLRVYHVEGLWIHPEHQRLAGVGRKLLRAMFALAHRCGIKTAVTAADTTEMFEWVARAGGRPLPPSFVLPMGRA